MEDKIKDVLKIDYGEVNDERGFFKEVIRLSEVEKQTGKVFNAKQVNHARSAKNTLRGMHVAPWNKVIYIVRGLAQVVIVDCRLDSPTFGKYESVAIGDENRSCIFVPAGCANSYLVLSEEADYMYFTDQEWEAGKEKSFAWNDPTIGIKWRLQGEPLLSERDKNNSSFLTVFPR